MDTRGSGCNESYSTSIFVNGVEIDYPKKEFGCSGDSILFSVTSNMPEPLSYQWSLDGHINILSTDPSFQYTFDNRKHILYCIVTSPTCAIGKTITVTGMDCLPCEIKCITQTALVPAGEFTYLIDNEGKSYQIDGKIVTSCITNVQENKLAGKAIYKAIKNALKCRAKTLTVGVFAKQAGLNCISVVINNSPIIFKQIKVGNVKYNFNTSRC